MSGLWLSLKKSLQCDDDESGVHDPKTHRSTDHQNIGPRKTCGSCCSRSTAILRDVIVPAGSKRQTEKSPAASCSTISIVSTHNPIRTFGPGGRDHIVPHYPQRRERGLPRKRSGESPIYGGDNGVYFKAAGSVDAEYHGSSSTIFCIKCHKKFKKMDAETHHLSKHAVTEVVEGDLSRSIVEMICKTSWSESEDFVGIERILKVQNMQRILDRFEEYREMVKIKATKQSTKHSRCLADGNELLRFFGTSAACSLGMNGSSSLCTLYNCGVCQILRHGFTEKEFNGGVGVFTSSTSGRALKFVEINEENPSLRRVLLVCRVIAGRVHKPLENFQDMASQPSGFDSLALKVGHDSHVEELYLLNPKALLPCFVVVCRS
ncbi:hypothetical protein Tsubulata_025526 [Turnera subulata]|uniref:C2H2-type domain-containing protein n=1 Tax=Turnera subulata TaxID=218843 RepID=A0A9Q0FJD6_9ROSI|nr:hypothetical protein Tsubulata_025526 [Turnera subulata]